MMDKKRWRPTGWENHYNFMGGGPIPKYEKQSVAFEAGADAMLGAMKGQVSFPEDVYDNNDVHVGIKVFIPDEEE